MAFQVSPGVQVKEKDLTNIIPAVATTTGAFAGNFEWGPCLEPTLISSEEDLVAKFGNPVVSTVAGESTRSDWYTAANFLSYANAVQITRILTDGARNAASEFVTLESGKSTISLTGTPAFTFPDSDGDGHKTQTVTIGAVTSGTAFQFTVTDSDDVTSIGDIATIMKNAINAEGNATDAAVDSDGAAGISGDVAVTFTTPAAATSPSVITAIGVKFTPYQEAEQGTGFATAAVLNNLDDFNAEESTLFNGSVYARYPGHRGNGIGVMLIDAGLADSDFKNTNLIGTIKAADYFEKTPSKSQWSTDNFDSDVNDEVHLIVYTTDTSITGSAYEVLETFEGLSKAGNGVTSDGGLNYYKSIVNNTSNWIYVLTEDNASGAPLGQITNSEQITTLGSQIYTANQKDFVRFVTNISLPGVRKYNLNGGSSGDDVDAGDYTIALDKFKDPEEIDIALILSNHFGSGSANETKQKVVQKYAIDNLAKIRKDCVVFASPSYDAAVSNPSAAKIATYFSTFNSTSYAVFDSGWKRMYDRYNDEYFWSPMAGDTAGITARAEFTNDAWWSPAGFNRGFVSNVVKLSFNPNQADRDVLYRDRINPVVTIRGQGTLLFGDKTALSRPSAFDRINVRRLFIVLEKAIATAAKFQLFEFNDDFTRANFTAAVEPFLQDIKARRGVQDFKVVCDASNNTSAVIDGNRFVADIYIKPNRSINFITLNFVAVRSGVSFEEVAGA
jgi:hypothetical protein|tara:strand:- start:11684 stop:13870 length:2187 start_codon:yes stop_codon:yes gene_type:complete